MVVEGQNVARSVGTAKAKRAAQTNQVSAHQCRYLAPNTSINSSIILSYTNLIHSRFMQHHHQ